MREVACSTIRATVCASHVGGVLLFTEAARPSKITELLELHKLLIIWWWVRVLNLLDREPNPE